MKKVLTLLGILTWMGVAAAAGPPSAGAEQDVKSKAGASNELRIDLNTATKEELAELPGIGEKVAARVIAYREENGRFEKTEELMNVKGIGEKAFLRIRDNLLVGPDSKKAKAKQK